MQKIDILPIFPQTLFHSNIILDEFKNNFIKKIFTEDKYEKINDNFYAMSVSMDKKILNKIIFLKTEIQNQFSYIAKNILKLKNDFIITSSWLTKAEKNQMSEFHVHTNALYSGIYYPELNFDISEIHFQKSNFSEISLQPIEYNFYNNNSCSISPVKGGLIFFPSNLNHKVGINIKNEPRYSLAFNLFPTGNLGVYDSFMEVKTFE